MNLACYTNEQEQELETQHIIYLFRGLNSDYEAVGAEILSQDPLAALGTVFTLF